jgi:cellulose synthase operon protein C
VSTDDDQRSNPDLELDFNLEDALQEWDDGGGTSPRDGTAPNPKAPAAIPRPAVPKPKPAAPAGPAAAPTPARPGSAAGKPAIPRPAPPTPKGGGARPLYRPPTPGPGPGPAGAGRGRPGAAPAGRPPGKEPARPAIPRPAPQPTQGGPPKGAARPAAPPAKPPGIPKPAAPPPEAPAQPPPAPSFADFADFDDHEEATAIGQIPEDLISSLKEAEPTEHDRPTRPPQVQPADGSVDLDLDELLDELEGPPATAKDSTVQARDTAEPSQDRPTTPPAEGPHDRVTREAVDDVDALVSSDGPDASRTPADAPTDGEDDMPEVSVVEGPDDADDDDDFLADLDDLAAPLQEVALDSDGDAPGADPDADDRPTQRPPPGMVLDGASGLLDVPPPPPSVGIEELALDDAEDRPTQVPPALPDGPAEPAEDVDQGAVAARRTVRYRKPREEHFPLVGRTREALHARRELLCHLAESSQGPHAATLWVTAGELSEQLGDFDRAHDLYRSARGANERDLVALRALRRYAMARDDFSEVAQLLEVEAGLELSAQERAHALTLLAEVRLARLGDPAGAEQSARAATDLYAGAVAARILLSEACRAQGKDAEAHEAIEGAVDPWQDGPIQAALLADVAFHRERRGDGEGARGLFVRAAAADAGAVDAWLGLARTARAAGDIDETVRALSSAAARLSGPLPEVHARLAAKVVHVLGQRPADALAQLADARTVLGLLAKADAALGAGDREAHQQSVEAWVAASGGTERALGLVTLAEVRSEHGDLEGADEALKDAALADGKLGTVRVVREVLARRAGDASRLARAVQGAEDGALGAAAKTAREATALPAERELLARAVTEGDSPLTADVIGLDATATAGDAAATAEALRRQAERASPDHRLGPLLTLARFFLEREDIPSARTALREARDLFPGDPLALRPLSRLVAAEDPREAAALWLEEASVADGVHSAFAATWAGRILTHGGGDAAGAFRRALDAEPGYAPAAWALEPLVRAQGDPLTLEEIHEQLAEAEADPVERAGRLVRAALLRSERDPQGAAALLERAREARHDDAILTELLLRLAGGTSPEERAALLEASAEHGTPELARSARLRAAGTWLDADEPARAAALYTQVLGDHPDDPFANEALDRAQLAAGQQADVAQRLRDAAEASKDAEGATRAAVLERLADFELHDRGDPNAAVDTLQSIIEVAPGHLPSLRALERTFMDQRRHDDLLPIEEQLVAHLQAPDDVAAHLRLARRLRLRGSEADGAAADDLLREHAVRAAPSLWLARRMEGEARSAGDHARIAGALGQILERLDGPNERTSILIRLADALDAQGEPAQAAEQLAPALEGTPDHPVAAELLGRLREAAGDARGAAEAFESAAAAASVDRRRTALWYRAGVLWQDDVAEAEPALAAFEHAAAMDLKHEDLFDRMRALLLARDDTEGLSRLVERRLAAGGDAQARVGLHLAQADLCEQLGDREGARQALRSALALEADRVDALRRLAGLCIEDEDWRGATETLIRVARLKQDRDELRWVFMQLGDIYHRHMPDPKRAEQAYRRVLKLNAHDVEALQQLADLFREQERLPDAVEVLRELCNRDPVPDRRRDHRLVLAEVLERHGDLRGAEGELEEARRGRPSDVVILRAVADFYRRQNAASALAMHLGRAVGDLRQAVGNDPLDEQAWHGLVEVLGWRGRKDAARCCASVAASVGVLDIELARLLDAKGGAPGAGAAAATPAVDDMIAPSLLTPATRRIFTLAGEAFEKVLPFDLKANRAERVGRDAPLRTEALEAARLAGAGDVHVYLGDTFPRACVPISGSPITVLMGRELLASTDAGERQFLLVRAIRIAQTQLAVAARAEPAHLAAALGALMHAYDPEHVPSGADPAQLEDLGRRLKKAVPRRSRDELGPLLLELRGSSTHDPAKLADAVGAFANRFALLALGSFPTAAAALLKTVSDRVPGADQPSERSQMLRRTPETWALFTFAISDTHFAARKEAGMDRR